MTITTDMLLAGGCEIWNFEGGRRAFSHDNWLVAYEVGSEWKIISYQIVLERYPVKPRFRVKAKSRPYIPATMFGPGDGPIISRSVAFHHDYLAV